MSLFVEDHAPLGQPYWWEGAEWPDLSAPPPERVDLCVIGAGYTGLSAAIAAHDTGAKVCVIDAGQPGQGASTRNGGMTGAHPRLGWEALRDLFGEAVADGIFAEAGPALGFVRDLIAREEIDCDFQQTGRIQLAWTAKHFAAQEALAARVREKSGIEAHVVARDELGSEIETERYFGGLVIPSHCAVHPWKYHNGLLQAVLRRGAAVIAHCPAVGIDRDAGGFTVRTPKGDIRAGKVLMATNGYTSGPFRWFQRRVFPLPSYLIATEPLPPNLMGHLAPGRRMMVETRARHSYFRASPDWTRFLYGGRASMRPIDMRSAARRLHATMVEVWPELAETKLSHVWWGNTGYSFTHMPSVGERDGVHYAMGFSGSGTVMAPYLGAKAAWRALGDARGETAYAASPLKTHWLHPGARPHFLKLADLWYRSAVDWRDSFQGR
ncbi:Oxidoreductase [Candidatus Rhodobacter oscarellae]|uniref:Oxidoreductase n=1 Tax=Candidatus Rhodobacter oscarellae TaxID=1675527 RepID=A0A0J9E4V7_9RHOB|nr:FAD-binding oxidoreductase [Candidatus Rhodobacter lobularis]KMW57781.1 Oxidoreductase [Candidatus Rhodobacter lobularis]